MPKTDSTEEGKSLHIKVPGDLHRKIKILCIVKECTMKSYLLAALKERVARDDKAQG